MNTAAMIKPAGMRDRVSEAEWKSREDTALCYRLMHKFGFTDLIYNHITTRVPGEAGAFLINAYGLHYTEITASSLYKIDHEGEVLEHPDTHYGVNQAGFIIHSAVHAARPDVNCVIHTHTPAGVAVSAMTCGLLPLALHSMRFAGSVGYHDNEGTVANLEERKSIARDLGSNNVLILRNHGLITCGSNVPEAFNSHYTLEFACKVQVQTMAAGVGIHLPSEQAQQETARLFRPGVRRPYGVMEWEALTRMMDREDPSYKT